MSRFSLAESVESMRICRRCVIAGVDAIRWICRALQPRSYSMVWPIYSPLFEFRSLTLLRVDPNSGLQANHVLHRLVIE